MEWRTILNCDEAVGGKIKDEKEKDSALCAWVLISGM